MDQIDELRARVDELARQHEVRDTRNVPMVRNPTEPTQEEIDKHELTHANFKPWCSHCQTGLAQRDRHVRKAPLAKNRYKKRNTDGDADVLDTEAPDAGVAKFSIDYSKMLSSED